ncbi:MAG: ParB/RepB/Spo0J family partition protein, partial [Gemmatimonadota bacterium]|nr:ParB/RepB/Spo0J family partition protein [Gemmatimonadota bacterium]
LQPVVVRTSDNGFELISGERRLRAATQLGWPDVPALIRKADERTMLTLALIENLQRTDLNSIEEARGYQRLHQEFNLTHQQIAEAVGKDRSTVTNVMRLLSLADEVQQLLEKGRISMGHARALLAISDPRAAAALARQIVAEDLSVRDTERRVRELTTLSSAVDPSRERRPNAAPHPTAPSAAANPMVRQIEDRLRRHFQTDAHLRIEAGNKGAIELLYYSSDDLTRLLELMLGPATIGD